MKEPEQHIGSGSWLWLKYSRNVGEITFCMVSESYELVNIYFLA
jgi:hypothetical protein